MADEQIKKTDLFEPGFLDEVIKSAEILNKNLELQNKLLKDTAKLYTDVAKNAQLTAKGLKDIDRAEKETIKLQQESEKVTREQIKNEQELERLKKLKVQTTQQEIRLGQQQKKIREQNNKALKQEEGAYARLSKRLNVARKELKDMLAAGRGSATETKKLAREVELLDSKLKSIDASAGQFQRNVGNYPKTFAKVGASFRDLIRLVGQFGIALGGVAIARDAFNVIVDFDQAMANLKAISGATSEELGRLEKQAKQLGATTSFTASEVAGLQTEFAKLGFKTSEIEAATESTLQFAKATGADLSSAAALSGSALRAFQLDASEAARVNSVLAVATTKTALDFSKLENGLSTVAPVANAFGFSIEETTALLGQLSNAGFDASSSATATRNILLNLADANGALAKQLGRPVTSAAELAEGLQELQAKGIDLATALELTDKRSVAAFETFLKGSKDLQPLVESLTDVEDELQNIADTQDNTLQGALARLRSAWEGYILGTDGATGASEKLRAIVEFLAENLDTIIDTVLRLGRAFLTFRTALFLTNKVVIPLSSSIKQIGVGMKGVASGTTSAAGAFKNFNSALKANIIGFVAVAVIELVDALDLFTSKAEKARQAAKLEKELTEQNISVASEAVTKNIQDQNKELNKKLETERQLTREAVAKAKIQGKSADEIQKIEDQGLENQRRYIKGEIERNRQAIVRLNKKKVENELELDAQKYLEERGVKNREEGEALSKLQQDNKDNLQQIAGLNAAIDLRKDNQFELEKKLKDIGIEQLEIQKGKSAQSKKAVKDKITEIDIERERLKLAIRGEQSDLKKIGLNKQLKDLEADRYFLKLLSEKRSEEEKKAIRDLYAETLRLNEVEKQREEFKAYQDRVKKIEEETQALEDLRKAYEDLRLEFLTADSDKAVELVDREIAAIQDKIKNQGDLNRLQQLEDQRQALMIEQVERLRDAEVKAAEDKYKAELKLLNIRRAELSAKLLSGEITDEEIKQLELLNKQVEQLEENKFAQIAVINKNAQNEIETIENQGYERRKKNQDNFNKQQIEKYKELADAIEQVLEQILKAIEENINKQIQLLDKQISASQNRQDQLREIAINGRGEIAEDAKKSLAQEEAREAQAEAKKAQLEKRKQVIEKTSIILKNIGNLVEQGLSIEQATAQSFSAVQIIEQLLQGLSGFYEGTDDTGKASNPLDNKGGRLAILHDNEQVWSKKDREKVGFKSRDEVIQAAQDGWRLASEIGQYQSLLSEVNGIDRMNTEVVQNHVFDTTQLQEEIRDVKNAIKNLKFPHGEAGEITSQFFRWISSDGKGNTTQYTIKKPRL